MKPRLVEAPRALDAFDNAALAHRQHAVAEPRDLGEVARRHQNAAAVGGVDDPEAETLVLVDLVSLGPDALAEARNEALALDRHAYEVSKVYRKTSPAKTDA